jgi:hypothetical protein
MFSDSRGSMPDENTIGGICFLAVGLTLVLIGAGETLRLSVPGPGIVFICIGMGAILFGILYLKDV